MEKAELCVLCVDEREFLEVWVLSHGIDPAEFIERERD